MPSSLKNTVYPFSYNNFDELENICIENQIGVIKMEVVRNNEPENNFLKRLEN